MPHRPLPSSITVLRNPDQDALRALALTHTPAVARSSTGTLNKVSRNKSRVAKYTYVIGTAEDAARISAQLIDPARAQALIARQQAFLESRGQVIEVQGRLGLGPRAASVQWLYSVEAANIAAMQQVLAFPAVTPGDTFTPDFRVIYTPDCPAVGMPGEQAIVVDLEEMTTYILGPDYFGESKKGALRMLCAQVYAKGGLVLHAGAKLVHVGDRDVTMTIMGLSGTGKTTTTFSKQGSLTQPVQDDMVALWPAGELSVTENGCFAKTFGLSEETEPVIWRGTLDPRAWTENVYLDEDGVADFSKGALSPDDVARLADVLIGTGADPEKVASYAAGAQSLDELLDERGTPRDGWDFVKWTENGRSIIPFAAVDDAADLTRLPPVRSMGILNRDEGADAATPGLVRFTSPEQAAGFFMLGETTKTSAAGKETGKTRSPFTQPFFPLAHGLQARRFSALAETMPGVDLWMMNTGFVGGDARSVKQGLGLKVKIHHSSAMLEAMLSGHVVWVKDPDFGYEVVDVDAPENAALLALVPAEILQPRRLFAAQGRAADHDVWAARMRRERREFLLRFGVDEAIITATCG